MTIERRIPTITRHPLTLALRRALLQSALLPLFACAPALAQTAPDAAPGGQGGLRMGASVCPEAVESAMTDNSAIADR